MLHPSLHHVHAVAFDLDGVLYEAEIPVPGAADAVAAVRAAGMSVGCVTTTTSISPRLVVATLARFGFDARVDELLCPSSAAAAWLRAERASAALFVPAAAVEDFDGLRQDEGQPDAVVIGDLDVEWDFGTLNRAFRLVH